LPSYALFGYAEVDTLRVMDAHVPLVFVSGAVREQEKQKAKDVGATEFIEKPFDSTELLKVVERLCS
jgi:CheY-like chemotaxis protein